MIGIDSFNFVTFNYMIAMTSFTSLQTLFTLLAIKSHIVIAPPTLITLLD